MDRFPAEIWQQIIDDCDIRTAKQLRCCSKDFNDFASSRVFEEVYFSFCSIDSIDRLREVAHHSALRHYVRRLFFFNVLLDQYYANYWNWERALDLRESYKASRRRNGGCRMAYIKAPKFVLQADEEDVSMTLVPRQVLHKGRDPVYTMAASRKLLKRYHHCLSFLLDAQKGILSSDVHTEIIDMAITNFPNLKDVRIRGWDWWSSLQLNSYDILAGDENASMPIVSALQKDVLLNYPFVKVDLSTDTNTAAFSLTRALKKAQKAIQVMDFDHIYWPIELAVSRIARNIDDFYTSLMPQDLRTLYLKLQWQGFRCFEPPAIALSAEFVDFPSCAFNLEEAFLDFEIPDEGRVDDLNPQLPPYYIWKWNDPNVPNLSCIFSHVYLPKLRRLRIGECALGGSAFTQFMTRHSQTLRSLEICDLKLVGDSQDWQPVMEEVAARMSLEKVKIDHLIDGVQEAHAQRLLGEPRGGNMLAFEERHRTVTAIWQDQGRLVADFLRCGGVGDYPCWPLSLPDDDKPTKSRARFDDNIY
ncbi:MAG: hypothetical protein Q9183_004928 [Haloplaca sp. 2 TL-2023]